MDENRLSDGEGMILKEGESWNVVRGDCLEVMRAMPADSIDLVFGSPPYEQARLYLENGKDLGVSRKTDEWVAWMVEVYREAQRVCRGLVAFVVAGQTRKFRWSAGPALLAADLHRAGFNLRNPPIFSRVGIPGSGGPDWLRGDAEFVICTTRPGKLPWSDPTATGHPPKWAPGGEMSHRVTDGTRRNQWGSGEKSMGAERACSGDRRKSGRPSHKLRTKGGSPKDSCKGRRVPAGTTVNGELLHEDAYLPPALANPGNIIHCNVGDELRGIGNLASPLQGALAFIVLARRLGIWKG